MESRPPCSGITEVVLHQEEGGGHPQAGWGEGPCSPASRRPCSVPQRAWPAPQGLPRSRRPLGSPTLWAAGPRGQSASFCALSRWGEQVPFIRASSCSLHTAGPRPGCLRARPCQQELGHSAPSSAPAEQAPGLEPPCGPSEAGHDFPPMPRGGLGGGGSHLATSSWRDGTRRPWPLASPEHMGRGCSCSQAAGLGQEDTPAGPGLWAEDAGLETSSRGQRLCWLHKVHGNSKQKQNPNPEVPQSVRSSQKPLPQLTPPAAAVREPGSSSRRGPGLTQKETRGSS